MPRSYYEVLGVARDANPSAIKAAWRRIAFETHPDMPHAHEALFREASEAYEVLSDPARRRVYDQRVPVVDSVMTLFRSPTAHNYLTQMLPRASAAQCQGSDIAIVQHASNERVLDATLPPGIAATTRVSVPLPLNLELCFVAHLERLGEPGISGGDRGDLWIVTIPSQ